MRSIDSPTVRFGSTFRFYGALKDSNSKLQTVPEFNLVGDSPVSSFAPATKVTTQDAVAFAHQDDLLIITHCKNEDMVENYQTVRKVMDGLLEKELIRPDTFAILITLFQNMFANFSPDFYISRNKSYNNVAY